MLKNDETEFDLLKTRLNNVLKLTDGSTSGDAELMDIRVGDDGKTYDTAGEAVRGQFKDVKKSIEDNVLKLTDGSADINAELVDIRIGYDNTTYSSAGEAVRGQVGELTRDLTNITDTIGGKIYGDINPFSDDNVFTIKGKKRNNETGILEDYAKGNVTPLIKLSYIAGIDCIYIKNGKFRNPAGHGQGFCYDSDRKYIGCSTVNSTYTTGDVSAYPMSYVKEGTEYISFYQYDNDSEVSFITYVKPRNGFDEIKYNLNLKEDEISDYIVTPNMTPKQFAIAMNNAMDSYATLNKCSVESFFKFTGNNILNVVEWNDVYKTVNMNFRHDLVDDSMSVEKVCDITNSSLTKKIRRFDDAKVSSETRDASITINIAKCGEPSAIISEDCSTLTIYAYLKKFSTTDGINWSDPVPTPLNDNKYIMHNNVNFIDGVYYMIGARQNTGGYLVLYTSTDGTNFTFKGNLFSSGVELQTGHPVDAWGNTYLIKEYGSNKFYLYIESQDKKNDEEKYSWRIHLVTYTNFDVENIDGTIGDYSLCSSNPVIDNPFEKFNRSAGSAGNPDFAKGMDNRPIKVDGKYYLYFHSTNNGIAHILRASSKNLIDWEVDGLMLDNRDIPTAGDEKSGNADACIIEFKGRTYLFYTWNINDESNPEYIKYTIDDRPICEILKIRP